MQTFEAISTTVGVVSGLVYLAFLQHPLLFVIAGYGLLLGTSTWFVDFALDWANGDYEEADDTGRVTGKLENALIHTFVLLQAYTALDLVFTANWIIR